MTASIRPLSPAIPGPDVNGKDGGGRVEDRGEGGHEGCHHDLSTMPYLVQMSIVKMVEAELKTEVREDMRAAIMTANIRPLRPVNI